MAENLEIYDLDSNLLGIQERESFYEEIKSEFAKKNKISRKVKTIRFLLMNSSGRIYIQKRSKIKNENAGLYDKTVGGHVGAGESFDITAIKECAEELGFPIAILDAKEFDRAVKVADLRVIGIGRKISYEPNFESVRIAKDGTTFIQPLMNAFYIGYYDGPIQFFDGESSGVETFSLDELKKELAENPQKATTDLKIMLDVCGAFLNPISRT